jgi:prepilin peptidase dependent protein B
MLTRRGRQSGLTLVELMIASSIALFALSALLTVYSATARHSSKQLQQAHLHQQLQATVQLMSRDLQRSGFWQFDPQWQAPENNPFMNQQNQLRTAAYPGEAADSCVLLSYDLDRDGLVGQGSCAGSGCAALADDDNVEQFGYRLRDGLVQSRYGGGTFSCDSGYWQAITDSTIDITRLEFIQHATCTNLSEPLKDCLAGSAQLIRHAIETRLRGELRAPLSGALELSAWTWIRNDQLLEGD